MKKAVILNTDPGYDDSVALLLAGTADVDVKGICTSFGNSSLPKTTRGAIDFVSLLGKEYPCSKGADRPLLRKREIDESSVFDVVPLPCSKRVPIEMPAWDFMYHCAKEAGELIIFSIAPMTNIAKAIGTYPDFSTYVTEIILLGGAVKEGNISAYAEFNVYEDPDALDIILQSGIKLTFLPADIVGSMTGISFNELLSLQTSSQPVNEVMQKYYRYVEERAEIFQFDKYGFVLYDAIAVCYFIDRSVGSTQHAQVRVELDESKENCGQTYFNFASQSTNAEVVTALDKNKVLTLLQKQFSLV